MPLTDPRREEEGMLITRSDDERLKRDDHSAYIPGVGNVLLPSLRATLARAEAAEAASIEMSKKMGYVDLETRIIELAEELDKAEAAKENLEAQLCQAREANERFKGGFGHLPEEERLEAAKQAIRDMESALSASSPCPCAEEANRLREGLESAQAELRGANYLIASLERMFPNWKSYRDLDDCIRCELAELRRRAGGPA